MPLPARASATTERLGHVAALRDGPRPLVIDVDGTLIRTDLLHESALQFVVRHPLGIWRLPFWLSKGRANLKHRLSEVAEIDLLTMPLHDETVAMIREAQQEGRPIFLASASPRSLIEGLAIRLGGVAGIFASDASTNLAGPAKAARLVAHFGTGGFDYVGNAAVDVPVWQAAARVFAVTSTSRIERHILGKFEDAVVIARPRAGWGDYMRALRPHQWTKNLLLFVPIVTSHKADPGSLAVAGLAFLAFCLAASSAYVLNDLLDLQADRAHPRKCQRPFASGRVPVAHGIAMSGLLLAAGMTVGAALAPGLLGVLCLYIAATLAYSIALKRQLIVDVIALSGLYTLRVFAGAAAIGTEISPWLLMFSLFLFLSLAVVKRCSELVLGREHSLTELAGRCYRVADLPVLTALAAAAGFGAVLIFALYLSSPEVVLLYGRPQRLWLATPVLLGWISRTIVLANRGEIHDDPVIFALTDKFSLACGLAVMTVVATAL